MPTETVPAVEVLGGVRWTPGELHQLAAATTEVPLAIDGAPAGRVVNVRAVGGRLLADLRGVPPRAAALIRAGRFARIGTAVYTDRRRGLRAVTLTGEALAPEPVGVQAYGRGSPTIVKQYVFDLRGARCAEDQEEAEMERVEETQVIRTEEIDAAVTARVHAYQQADPTLTFEAAYRQLPLRDPALWRLYAEQTYARVVPMAADPAEARALAEWREAGREVLAAADQYQEQSPELSREDAIRAVLRDNAELTRRYLRGRTPPGS